MLSGSQMNTIDKKRPLGVTLVGWILILYPVYVLIYPIIASILISIFNPALVEEMMDERGPAGGSFLLQATSASPAVVMIIQIAALLTVLIPICSLIGGILVLKLKNSARKFVVAIFSLDIISKIFLLIMASNNIYPKHLVMKDTSSIIFFVTVVILEIILICFLLRSKIKAEFIKI